MRDHLINFVKKLFYLLGVDARKVLSLKHLPRLLRDFFVWKRKGGKTTNIFPIVSDYADFAGVSSGHYFHQDLLVARAVFTSSVENHIDIGSRIDGFVAHVAAFQPIRVLDIRPLPESPHPNIIFEQADFSGEVPDFHFSVPSLSCLHALEHFGLGRYGDPIEPLGHMIALRNMIKILDKDGLFYLSIPLDKENTVQFNAHRTFRPNWLLELDIVTENLRLLRFDYVDGRGELYTDIDCTDELPFLKYGCGIYTFRKL